MEYKSIQVSLGDVSGAFLTYDGQTYTFRPPAPLYGLEGAADTMSNEGVITRRSCYKVFSGSEAFSFKLNTNPEYCSIYMSGTAFPEALRPVDYSAGMQFLCSHLPFSKKVSSGYVDRTENGITGYNDRSAAFIMTFRRDQIGNPSSASGFAAWAREQADAGTPLALCYPLANPVIEQIEGQDIAALVGLNTVYETGWPVSVAWYHVLPPGMGLEYRG